MAGTLAQLLSAQTSAPVWWSDRPCQAALGRRAFHIATVSSAPSTQSSCQERSCAHLPNGAVVCQCLSDTTRTIDVTGVGPRPLHFVRERGSAWPDSFDVIQADLDGDGSPEIVVATFDAASNGMGVAYWTVYVLSPGRMGWKVDSLGVQDYSSIGSWVALPKEKRCNLLQTAWVEAFEPRRGEGLYFQARWKAFEIGRFIDRVDRPTLRRRFLFRFEHERGDTTITNAPWRWLRSRDTWSSDERPH